VWFHGTVVKTSNAAQYFDHPHNKETKIGELRKVRATEKSSVVKVYLQNLKPRAQRSFRLVFELKECEWCEKISLLHAQMLYTAAASLTYPVAEELKLAPCPTQRWIIRPGFKIEDAVNEWIILVVTGLTGPEQLAGSFGFLRGRH
jgi:hypothetical protein